MSTSEDAELEVWIRTQGPKLDPAAKCVLRSMEPSDRKRVMAAGPMTKSENPSTAVQARVRKSRETEKVYMAALTGSKGVKATVEEAEQFLKDNDDCMDGYARRIFTDMKPEDQGTVIAGGPMGGATNIPGVMYGRVKRAKALLAELAPGPEDESGHLVQKEEQVPFVDAETAALLQEQFVNAPVKALSGKDRRFAAPASNEPVVEEQEKPLLVGEVKGMGGVVEILKAKYCCKPEDRLRVIGEGATIWKLEGGKSIPKAHENQGGWRWVIESADVVAKNKEIEAKQFEAKMRKEFEALVNRNAGPPSVEQEKQPREEEARQKSQEEIEEERRQEEEECRRKQALKRQQQEMRRQEETELREELARNEVRILEEEKRRREELAKNEALRREEELLAEEGEARRRQEQARRREEQLKRKQAAKQGGEAAKKAEEKKERRRVQRIERIHAELARRKEDAQTRSRAISERRRTRSRSNGERAGHSLLRIGRHAARERSQSKRREFREQPKTEHRRRRSRSRSQQMRLDAHSRSRDGQRMRFVS